MRGQLVRFPGPDTKQSVSCRRECLMGARCKHKDDCEMVKRLAYILGIKPQELFGGNKY